MSKITDADREALAGQIMVKVLECIYECGTEGAPASALSGPLEERRIMSPTTFNIMMGTLVAEGFVKKFGDCYFASEVVQ